MIPVILWQKVPKTCLLYKIWIARYLCPKCETTFKGYKTAWLHYQHYTWLNTIYKIVFVVRECSRVFDLWQYGHLNNFLFGVCFVLFCNLKKKIGKIDVAAVFNLMSWMTTCFGKICAFGSLCVSFLHFVNLCVCVCVLLPLWFWERDVGFDCINPWALLIFLLLIYFAWCIFTMML